MHINRLDKYEQDMKSAHKCKNKKHTQTSLIRCHAKRILISYNDMQTCWNSKSYAIKQHPEN